jgi:hypothetical protein
VRREEIDEGVEVHAHGVRVRSLRFFSFLFLREGVFGDDFFFAVRSVRGAVWRFASGVAFEFFVAFGFAADSINLAAPASHDAGGSAPAEEQSHLAEDGARSERGRPAVLRARRTAEGISNARRVQTRLSLDDQQREVRDVSRAHDLLAARVPHELERLRER